MRKLILRLTFALIGTLTAATQDSVPKVASTPAQKLNFLLICESLITLSEPNREAVYWT